jgi:hypothetical protein
MIDELIKDKENLEKQLVQTRQLEIKLLGAIEYISNKLKIDMEKNKPKEEKT